MTENSPDEPPPLIYPSIRQSGLIAGLVILLSIVCSPLILTAPWIGDEFAFLAYYLLTFGLSLRIVHAIRKRRQGTSTYHFHVESWRLVPLIAVGTVGLLVGVVSPINALIPVPESMKPAMQNLFGRAGFATFLCLVFAAPILEELIFRGIILDGLLRRYRPLTAIVLSSVLFGLVHLNPWQFVTGYVLGCFFGWIYARTGSVGCCIIGHMSANGCAYVLRLILYVSGLPVVDSGAMSSRDRLWTAVLWGAALIVSALSIWLLRREFNQRPVIGAETVNRIGAEA